MATSLAASVLAWRAAHRRAMAVVAVALLLAAVAFFLYPPQAAPPEVPDPRSQAQKRSELEHCAQGALLFHDVRWAAACMVLADEDMRKHASCLSNASIVGHPQLGPGYCDATFGQTDGSPDCDLPNAQAANLYALLQEAERKCMAEWTRLAR
jgi:hypothetical protein